MTVVGTELGRPPAATERVSLVDLLDRLLGTGVVVTGDIVVALDGIDLIEIRLRALIRSVRSDLED
jgi:hypothetical protein